MPDFETTAQTATVFTAVILAIGFFWLLWIISPKLLGLFFLAAGVFIALKFPGLSSYEKPEMTSTVIAIGIIMAVVGILLVIFV